MKSWVDTKKMAAIDSGPVGNIPATRFVDQC